MEFRAGSSTLQNFLAHVIARGNIDFIHLSLISELQQFSTVQLICNFYTYDADLSASDVLHN